MHLLGGQDRRGGTTSGVGDGLRLQSPQRGHHPVEEGVDSALIVASAELGGLELPVHNVGGVQECIIHWLSAYGAKSAVCGHECAKIRVVFFTLLI